MVVVLPAPLWPRKDVMCPSYRLRLSCLTATLRPSLYTLVRLSMQTPKGKCTGSGSNLLACSAEQQKNNNNLVSQCFQRFLESPFHLLFNQSNLQKGLSLSCLSSSSTKLIFRNWSTKPANGIGSLSLLRAFHL